MTPAVPSGSGARSIEGPLANPPAPTAAEDGAPHRQRDIHEICAQSAEVGIGWCNTIAAGDPKDCVEMCMTEYRSSHTPQQAVPRRPIGTPVSVAPSALPPPDPYFFALADCIHRAREGEAPSVCRFSRPVDQMDFGQKQCDARCAELAHAAPAAIPLH